MYARRRVGMEGRGGVVLPLDMLYYLTRLTATAALGVLGGSE